MEAITIDVVSDVVCPWCFLGKQRLDKAIESVKDDLSVSVTFRPYQLNPDMPSEGADHKKHLAEKLGGTDAVERAHTMLAGLGREDGIAFDFPAVAISPNTLDAHRLIHWAGIENLQSPVVTALMRAYWVEGRDIGDLGTLADIAGENGMDREATLRLLQSDADGDDIQARDQDARHKGVNSVPTFLIAQQYVVSGAQPPETWGKVIEELMGRAD